MAAGQEAISANRGAIIQTEYEAFPVNPIGLEFCSVLLPE